MTDGVYRYDRIDPATQARADALLARMTLPEKIGQLVQVAPLIPPDTGELPNLAPGEQAAWRPLPGIEEQIRAGAVGSLLNLADPELVNRYQRLALEESRLGIPLIIGSDVIHGFRTVFPIPLAEACSWHPALLERAARVAAEEASAHGVDWFFAPMVDVARDPRWGRVAEGAGEDAFLCGVLAQARVRGFQAAGLASGRRVAACPKHYAAYGAAEAGPERVHPVAVISTTIGAWRSRSARCQCNQRPTALNPITITTAITIRHERHQGRAARLVSSAVITSVPIEPTQ